MDRAARRRAHRANKAIEPRTILWHSNAPWAGTGYGTQTKQVVERIKRDGHAIAVNANYGLQGTQLVWEDIPIFPMGVDQYSNDTVRANFTSWTRQHPNNPAQCIVLFDAWTMPREMYKDVPLAIWTMVDHQPIPPKVAQVLQWPNVTPIAVTQFGLDQMRRIGLTKAVYIPMAIDTELYKPTDTFNGQTGRSIMGLEDDVFVVSTINANKAGGAGAIHRKAWGENLLAFSIFAQDKPDARLYLHTERYGNHGGLALDVLLKAVGLKEHQYKFVSQHALHNGIPNEAMAAIYTATDVLLASTLGEGFGLTLLEAQACGTVAIANNFSAQPELLGDGWLTDGQPYWDGAQFAWFNTPNIPSIVDGLEQAYARGRGRSDKARQHALQYDADTVWETYWRPYLAGLDERPAIAQTTRSSQTVPQVWENEHTNKATLTLYIPAFKRQELRTLLQSLANQLTSDCELIVSDDDPNGSAWQHVQDLLSDAPCRVQYIRNSENLGAETNKMRGLTMGTAEWVWVLGDDDDILPNGIAHVLAAIAKDDCDRLILLTKEAPTKAAGVSGAPALIAEREPALLIAATCTSANVYRRSALDVDRGKEYGWTMYGHSFADAWIRNVHVLEQPAIAVGPNHAGEYAQAHGFTGDVYAVWKELLHAYGIANVGPEHFAWNFVSLQLEPCG